MSLVASRVVPDNKVDHVEADIFLADDSPLKYSGVTDVALSLDE